MFLNSFPRKRVFCDALLQWVYSHKEHVFVSTNRKVASVSMNMDDVHPQVREGIKQQFLPIRNLLASTTAQKRFEALVGAEVRSVCQNTAGTQVCESVRWMEIERGGLKSST